MMEDNKRLWKVNVFKLLISDDSLPGGGGGVGGNT